MRLNTKLQLAAIMLILTGMCLSVPVWGQGHHGGGPMGPVGGPGTGMQHQQQYTFFEVDTSGDVFTNRERFNSLAGGPHFVDEDGDGVCDFFQNTEHYAALGFGPFRDANGDRIADVFQTPEAYRSLGMSNFADVDGDGLCDNYEAAPRGPHEEGNFRGPHAGPQVYHPFEVDLTNDVFVDPERFNRLAGGSYFVDEDGDGVCDFFQDTEHYAALGFGPFRDANGDHIADVFQTPEAYRSLGMANFVDVDGDGLCDNYEASPFE